MSCERCPLPALCLRRPEYCRWAAEEPQDPLKMRAIVDRSRIAASPTASPAPPSPASARPSAAESLALTRKMNACPFRSRGPGCGCSGANCSLRGGAIVNHVQCFDCIRRYG